MESNNKLTEKKLKTLKTFVLYINIMFLIGMILIILYSIPVNLKEGINALDIIGTTFLIIIFIIGYLHFFFRQFYLYNITRKEMKYSLKLLDFAIKKKPYGIIELDKIEKVEKIATKIGLPLLLKVYTKDGKIHYIGNKDQQGAFLYALKERDFNSLIKEERKDMSRIKKYFLRLKGGKIEEK